jgi:hypothetical protein
MTFSFNLMDDIYRSRFSALQGYLTGTFPLCLHNGVLHYTYIFSFKPQGYNALPDLFYVFYFRVQKL